MPHGLTAPRRVERSSAPSTLLVRASLLADGHGDITRHWALPAAGASGVGSPAPPPPAAPWPYRAAQVQGALRWRSIRPKDRNEPSARRRERKRPEFQARGPERRISRNGRRRPCRRPNPENRDRACPTPRLVRGEQAGTASAGPPRTRPQGANATGAAGRPTGAGSPTLAPRGQRQRSRLREAEVSPAPSRAQRGPHRSLSAVADVDAGSNADGSLDGDGAGPTGAPPPARDPSRAGRRRWGWCLPDRSDSWSGGRKQTA